MAPTKALLKNGFQWPVFVPAKPAYMPSLAIAGFCSCKTGIHAIPGNNPGSGPGQALGKTVEASIQY